MNFSRYTTALLALLLASAQPGCGSREQGSPLAATEPTSPQGNDAPPPKPLELTFDCKESVADLGEKKAEHTGVSGDKFDVKANWCFPATSGGSLANVLLIVDFSGSMEWSDPWRNGSCGRLAAAKALLAAYKSSTPAGNDGVRVAVVGFADDARVISDFAPLASVESLLDASNLCLQIGGTFYSRAFMTAETTLSRLAGANQKAPLHTYFVTDGVPSEYPDQAYAAADRFKQAAASVNQASTLSAVFLEGTPPPGVPAAPPFVTESPTEVLGRITGDPARVRVASNASDLVSKVTELLVPSASLEPSSVSLVLTGKDGSKTQPCDGSLDCSVVMDPQDPGRWSVSLKLPLSGDEGQKTDNAVEIIGKRTDGSAIRAKAIVSFTSMR